MFWTWERTSNIMFSAVHSKNTLIQSSLQHPFMLFARHFAVIINCLGMPYVSELIFCPCSFANTYPFDPKVNILYNHNVLEMGISSKSNIQKSLGII